MWGGLMCPIIPVMKQLPRQWRAEVQFDKPLDITRGLLQFFEPDVFIETAAGQFALAGLEEKQSGYRDRLRYRKFSELTLKEHGLSEDLNIGVNIYDVYEHLYRTEFQYEKRNRPNIYNFKGGDKQNQAFFEAAFGMFPRGKLLPYLPSIYKQVFGAQDVKPDIEIWRDIVAGRAGYPLFYTTRNIDTIFGHSSPSVFIFDPLNAADVIDFWNFRIFNRDVMPVSIHWLPESRENIFAYIRRNYRLLPTNPNGVMIRTHVHVARSLDSDNTFRCLCVPEPKVPPNSFSLQSWYPRIWSIEDDDYVVRPTPGKLIVKSKQVQLTPSQSDQYTLMNYPALSPDFQVHNRGQGPGWVNVLQTRQYGRANEIADAMPSSALGNRDGYPVRGGNEQFVAREGLVTFHNFAHDSSYINLATPRQAIVSWLDTERIKAVPSSAGRIADQVIASVGGLNGCNIFEPEIVQLLDKMARSRREWPDGNVDEFPDRTATVSQWQKTLSSVHQRLFGDWKTLDRLVADGILQLGLTASCPNCTQENWYSLDDVASRVNCSRCRKTFDYPQGPPKSKEIFKYRVVGPFATPNFAEGAYSVALTLKFLEYDFGMGDFTYSTGLELTRDGVTRETDFFAWKGKGRFSQTVVGPATIVGECKSYAKGSFDVKDVDRLRELAILLPGSVLVAATLKKSLSEDEKVRLARLAQWGWKQAKQSPLIVLTGHELYGHGPTTAIWKDAGGNLAKVADRHSYIRNHAELAALTQEVHLGLDTETVSNARYGRRRRARMKSPKADSK